MVYRLLLRLLLTCKEAVVAGVVFDWLLGSNRMIYEDDLLGFMSHKKCQRKKRIASCLSFLHIFYAAFNKE